MICIDLPFLCPSASPYVVVATDLLEVLLINIGSDPQLVASKCSTRDCGIAERANREAKVTRERNRSNDKLRRRDDIEQVEHEYEASPFAR